MVPAQSFQLMLEEVHNDDDFRYLLRSSLARSLMAILHGGWKRNGKVTLDFLNATHGWASRFQQTYYSACLQVINNLESQTMPDNWIPESTDDSNVAEAFCGVEFNWVMS